MTPAIAFSAARAAVRMRVTSATVSNIASITTPDTRSRTASNSARMKSCPSGFIRYSTESTTASRQSSNSAFVFGYGLAASVSFSLDVRCCCT